MITERKRGSTTPGRKAGDGRRAVGWWRRLSLPGRRSPTGRGGFTLIEVLVVLGILAIGILPLAMVQTRARREVSKSNRYTQAITVAQAQLEGLKGAGFGNAQPDSGQAGPINWRTNIQNVAFGLDRVEVVVTWNDGVRNQTLQVSDLVSMR